jgi:OOP family OmpA-OmpF porin
MRVSITPASLLCRAALPVLLLAGPGCAQLRTLHKKRTAPPPPASAPAEPEIDPNLAPDPPPPPPAPAPRPQPPAKITLDGAWLRPAPHGWKLDPKGLAAVREIAGKLQAYGPGLRVLVNGFTSGVGNRAHNLVLSHRRAEVVEKALIHAGVPPDEIVARGFGPDQPIASNATRDGRLKNLRVEVEFQIR